MKQKVLLTGASGFVGANLARRLLGEGHEVHLLMRPGWKSWRLEDVIAHCPVMEADMAADAGNIADLVARVRPDWVFHLAVYGAYPSQKDSAAIMRTNVTGSVNLMDACARAGCVEAFVQAGSSSEYGAVDHAPREEEPARPNSAYGVSKVAATLYAQMIAQSVGLRSSTLRLYSTYGPWEEPTRLMPTLLRHAREGKLPPLASPESAHDFVCVEDVVDAFLLAGERATPGSVYNIGTGVQTTLAELVELVRRLFGVAAEPVWNSLSSRPWDTSIWVANPARAEAELGWRARVTLEEGLRRAGS